MLKSLFASTALAGALAAAAFAQEPTPADPKVLPLPEESVEAEGAAETEAPVVAEDPADAEAPVVAEDPVEGEAPIVAEEPVDGEAPIVAEEPAEGDAPMVAEDPAAPLEETWNPVEIETVSADELIGAPIRATPDDAKVATVDDVLLAPDGTVESVVAEFGGFLGFGREKVLLAPEEIDVFKGPDAEVLVRTSLTSDALEMMPEYEG